MDPLIVFDCQNIVPNRFALALAAAARTRALNHGDQPRVEVWSRSNIDVALSEIAAGAFAPEEIERYLPVARRPTYLPHQTSFAAASPQWQMLPRPYPTSDTGFTGDPTANKAV